MPYRASEVGPSTGKLSPRTLGLCLLLLPVSFFLAACGHGSTTTTTTGVAPIFTSTAPKLAREGVNFVYDLTATTTDGSTVTYTVSSGPSEATITSSTTSTDSDGNTVSSATLNWVPTHAESRTADAFTIKATTSNNGTVNQTFSVTPNGTVDGTVVDHAVTTGGIVDVNADLTAATIEILLPDGTGGYNSIHGSGDSSGNFSVPNIPPGSYLLHISRTLSGVTSNRYIWTTSSDVDAGTLLEGRPDVVPGTGVSIHASSIGTSNPGTGDTVQWVSPDARAYNASTLTGITNPWSATFAQTGGLIDSTKGDRAYLVHYKPVGTTYNISAITEDIEYKSITETSNSTVTLTGNMTAINGQTTDPVIKLTQFDAILTTLANLGTPVKTFALNDVGYSGTEGFVAGVPLVTANLSGVATDVDLGSITFGTVTPSGTAAYHVSDVAPRSYSGGLVLNAGLDLYSEAVPTSSTSIVPVIGAPRSVLVNGFDFFSNQTVTTTEPPIAWSNPSTGTATSFELAIYDLSSASATPQATLYVTGTGVTIPPNVLVSGKSYAFTLTAVSNSNNTFSTAPFRQGTTVARTTVASGVMTISASASTRRGLKALRAH